MRSFKIKECKEGAARRREKGNLCHYLISAYVRPEVYSTLLLLTLGKLTVLLIRYDFIPASLCNTPTPPPFLLGI